MGNEQRVERVSFITLEDGDDLIVSFAISSAGGDQIRSLTLLRDPKCEVLLPVDERGVSVSYDGIPQLDDDFLERVRFSPPRVEVFTTSTRFTLDVSEVEDDELEFARRVLNRMNFDGQLLLEFE